MKITYQTITTPCLILITATFIAGGCASTGLQRSEEVQTTMKSMDNEIKEAAQQLEVTESTLETLIKPGKTDVEKAFNSFTENVSKLESTEEEFASHADQMKAQGNNYFEEWEKDGDEYENPKIQQLSEQRRKELESLYDQVAEISIEVSENFDSYVSEIKEIQSYLSNDLTSKGIAAIAPTTKEVVSKGDSLKQAIRKVKSSIQKVQTEMSREGIN